jgi:hypothetical protein
MKSRRVDGTDVQEISSQLDVSAAFLSQNTIPIHSRKRRNGPQSRFRLCEESSAAQLVA